MDFIQVTEKSGEYICQQIVAKWESMDWILDKCCGQSYDSGSNMYIQRNTSQNYRQKSPIRNHAKSILLFHDSTTLWDIIKLYTKTNLKGSSETRWI